MQQYGTMPTLVTRISVRLFFPVVAAVLLASSACSQGDTQPPVATVTFSANKTRVPLGSPLELTYRFNVAPDAKFDNDYRVFVHFVDADGGVLWNDDHDPNPPTTQWRPGQTIQYTRTRFLPVVPFLGEVKVTVGLYRDSARLPLQGLDPADRESTTREYKVGVLTLLPTSENIFIFKKNGWHPTEFAAENPTLEWEWTQKVATLTLKNPRKDVYLYLEFDARTDVFPDRPQQVSVFSGDQMVDTFPAATGTPTLKRIPVTAAQLGTNEMAELRIEVDRTFVPAKLPAGGRDVRELGIRVYNVFVETR
jgi:hypothetical protein